MTRTRCFRGRPPARRDVAVAAGVTLLELLSPRTGLPAADPTPGLAVLGLVLGVAQGVPLAWRRTWPGPVLVIVTVAFALHALLLFPVPPYGSWVALAALASRREARTAALATAALVATVIAVFWVADDSQGIVVPALLTLAIAVSAQLVRERRARAAASVEQAAAEERLRIARDLHDVLGHSLSGIAVQSSTGRLALDSGQPDVARAALVAIESASRDSMQEVRTVLGEIREATAPGLAAIDHLVRSVPDGPAKVTIRRRGDLDGVPAPIGRVAYRVVQESLTNLGRHAGPCSAQVTLRRDGNRLLVEVVDDGLGATPTSGGGGHGLLGMRERVAAVGGQLEAGPGHDGGWQVRAELPAGGPEEVR